MKQHKNSKASRQRELRLNISPQRFEIRKNADGSRSISGYAARFSSLSEDLGGFREQIKPGAFRQSLIDNPDVLCLYGHDTNQILGRASSNTLTIAEDSKGLKFNCVLPSTSTARDLIALMERGDVSQMSFGFMVNSNGDSWDEVSGQLIRTLMSVTLFEISVVGQPAYTSTSVNLRGAPAAIRARLKRDDDDNSDDDDCDCDCDFCDADDCENCDAEDCDDEACAAEGCPAAGQMRTLRLRLRLAQHRAKVV